MKIIFSILTIVLIVIGFVAPLAWVAAIISGIIAIGIAPAGKRPDGKAKTGGLLGSIWDNYQVSKTMINCPFCKSKIMNEAAKCPNCGEWVKEIEPGSQANHTQNNSVGPQSIKEMPSKIGYLEIAILILVGIIIVVFIVGKLKL
jgi:hypothetical protein